MAEGSLATTLERLRAFAARRDWEQFHNPKNLVMALSGEVGELSALFQWLPLEEAARLEDPVRQAAVEDELADVASYLLLLADRVGVDLLAAVDAKLHRNELRFPVKGASHIGPTMPTPGGDDGPG